MKERERERVVKSDVFGPEAKSTFTLPRKADIEHNNNNNNNNNNKKQVGVGETRARIKCN